MKQKFTKRLLNIAAICALAFTTHALDLPTQTINGVKYYYYTVKKGETLYSISHMLGIGRDEIVAQNPGAADGLHVDQILYFRCDNAPADKAAVTTASASSTSIEPIVEQPHTPTPVVAEVIHVGGTNDSATDVEYGNTDTVPVMTVENRKRQVALFMPFMIKESGRGKVAEGATEFYRGFLLGLDTLANSGVTVDIDLHVYDTENKMLTLKKTLAADSLLKTVDLIIAPDNAEQTELLGKWGKKYKMPVLNLFAARDTSYLTNPYVINANISTDDMLEKAADKFLELTDGYKPVILRQKGGDADKQNFVRMLEKRWLAKGVVPLTVEYTDRVTEKLLSEKLSFMPSSTKYVFISPSASRADFGKYAMALPIFNEKISANGGEIMLLGYPEWTTFRSDALKAMHNDNTVIYSRFYNDANSFGVQEVDNSFEKWYGRKLADGVPSLGLMGYDAAHFVVKMLSDTYTMPSHNGLQSNFYMQHPDDENAGYVNSALQIVRFMPGGIIENISL